jgi:hypothetical protein
MTLPLGSNNEIGREFHIFAAFIGFINKLSISEWLAQLGTIQRRPTTIAIHIRVYRIFSTSHVLRLLNLLRTHKYRLY